MTKNTVICQVLTKTLSKWEKSLEMPLMWGFRPLVLPLFLSLLSFHFAIYQEIRKSFSVDKASSFCCLALEITKTILEKVQCTYSDWDGAFLYILLDIHKYLILVLFLLPLLCIKIRRSKWSQNCDLVDCFGLCNH